jgi:hypothetical protein
MIHRNLQEACKVLHLSSILEHYDEVVFENKEQFLQDILNLEIEARQSKKSINFNKKKQNLES